MQSKGIIKWLAILLGVASIIQLSFTFVTRGVEKDAAEYAKKAATEMVAERRAAVEAQAEKMFGVVDSIATDAEKAESKKAIAKYVAENFDEKQVYADAYAEHERLYLEKKWDEPVYNLGIANYTYGDCKERELNLGLDLRGGMNVMLEVKPTDVILTDVEKCKEYVLRLSSQSV